MRSRTQTRDSVILRDAGTDRWLRFTHPVRVLVARRPDDVLPVLERVSEANREGLWAAGFLAYEAAPALDRALTVQPADRSLPLAWFGIYERVRKGTPAGRVPESPPLKWHPSVSKTGYVEAVDRIRAYIASGDTYQVNFSYRLRAAFTGEAWGLFSTLAGTSPPPFATFVDTGRFAVCSLSPELFFELEGGRVVSRPMKGTAPRGLLTEDDQRLARRLQDSAKDRAENVMIVDMMRNDLGRIARHGSVHVPRRFDVERFPGLWQMTSTVAAETDAGLPDLFRALFPAASITGAPKARTMEIIAELEDGPRGVYTGAIGYAGPGRRARFSVAIRTAVLDRERGEAEYGVGGGVVWDSTAHGEWEECRTKAGAVTRPAPVFRLLETILWTPGEGFALLEEHLDRLGRSAAYFGFRSDRAALVTRLESEATVWTGEARRVRLLLSPAGELEIESAVLDRDIPAGPCRVALCPEPVDPGDRFLYHKTTHRGVYEGALAANPGCDDVLLRNVRGELTESCLANVLVEMDGAWFTPPVRCGLLPGIYRARMLAEGRMKERVIPVDDLPRCSKIMLVNSVRGEREAVLSHRASAGKLPHPTRRSHAR